MSPKWTLRVIAIVGAAASLLEPAFSQNRGGASSTPPAGSTGTTGRPTTPSIPTRPSQPTPEVTGPIFISGRVVLEDGSAPPERAVIERVCNGSPHSEGYTDSKGYFSIELGARNTGMLQDASESGNPSGFGGGAASQSSSPFGSSSYNRFMNCDLRARLTGYRSQTLPLINRRPLDDPNIGTILLHRVGESEGQTISALSAAAPKDARKALEKGQEAQKKDKRDEALAQYQKAVEIYPKYSVAWMQLGRLQATMQQIEAAQKSFETARDVDPKFVEPHLELARLAVQSQDWPKVAEHTQRVIKLDPFDYPQAFLYNGIANFNMNKIDEAEKSVREADRLDTRHQFPQSAHLLGVILAQRQDYTGAALHLRNYLKYAPTAANAGTVRQQLEQMEKNGAGQPAGKQ